MGLGSVKLGEHGADPDARDPAMMPPPKMIQPSLHGPSMPAPRSMGPPPPPPPKFTPSRTKPEIIHKDSILQESRSEHMPDTLVKLMEYGDEDDDPDETSTEPLNSSTYASRKPFWAV
ncbi:hypothetical protein SAY86_005333 [Trapa natans]|uniref:Uncharacterized protein n=1 Tax=Trapa natans TaxID=22666 RepID=A0AAN7QUR0_TRANT|nr:hypothetical protein SAY86_005333 [Trapa natans]